MILEKREAHEVISVFILVFFLGEFSNSQCRIELKQKVAVLLPQRSWGLRPNPGYERSTEN